MATIAGSAEAAIVRADVGKAIFYRQTSASTYIPFNAGLNGVFFARAFYDSTGTFDGGSLSYGAAGSPKAFNTSGLLDCCGNPGVGYSSGYLTPAAMNSQFPTGLNYTLTATNSVTSTSQSVTIPFLTDMYDLAVPMLDAASWSALQAINPSAGLTLNFNSFSPNPAAQNTQAFFVLRDMTTNSIVVNLAGLNASQTSVAIGAGTFMAGHSYNYEIIFDDFVQSTLAGVNLVARSNVRTLGYFSVATPPVGAPVPEPGAWALMIAGFGGVGAMLRRSRRLAPAA